MASPRVSYLPTAEVELYTLPTTEKDELVTTEMIEAAVEYPKLSRLQTFTVITCVTCSTGVNGLLTGLMTLIIPNIANSLNISNSLVLWYANHSPAS